MNYSNFFAITILSVSSLYSQPEGYDENALAAAEGLVALGTPSQSTNVTPVPTPSTSSNLYDSVKSRERSRVERYAPYQDKVKRRNKKTAQAVQQVDQSVLDLDIIDAESGEVVGHTFN